MLHHKVVLRQSPPAPVAFTAASDTQTIFLFGIPAKHVVVGIVAKLVVTFAATGLSNCTVSIGSTSQVNGAITSTNFLMPNFVCTQSETATLGPCDAIGSTDNVPTVTMHNADGSPLSQVTNFYNGYTLTVVSGTGAGQTRTVTAYQPSTMNNGIFTVSENWSTLPFTDSVITGSYYAQSGTVPFMYWSPFTVPNVCTDPQDIYATFTSTGAQLATLTAGELEITVMYRAF